VPRRCECLDQRQQNIEKAAGNCIVNSTVLFSKYNYGEQLQKNEKGGRCSSQGRERKLLHFQSEYPMQKRQSGR